MECNYFGVCGSCKLHSLNYNEQLELKKEKIKDLFGVDEFDIITSPPSHFRRRAEFRIYHSNKGISYAMHKLDLKGLVEIESCSIVSKEIYELMPTLLSKITRNSILKERLFTIEFLCSSTTKEILTTLIYHKKIDESWAEEAKKLGSQLGINIIGRSRKVKLVLNKDYIDDEMSISKINYRYRLYDGSFVQPNPIVNEKMIEWVLDNVPNTNTRDLLELYCGHGNFTLPLSSKYRKILATEVSKNSIKAAKENCKINNIENIAFLRLSSEEFTQAQKKEREFNRAKDIDLDSYNFSTIFVDPPRAGVDSQTIELMKKFENIIYISCNPDTLKRDLVKLSKYNIERFAIFDQFAYSNHIECGVVLRR